MSPGAGRRGSRSDSKPAQPEHPVALAKTPPVPPATVMQPAAPRRSLHALDWMGPIAGLVVGGLLARLFVGDAPAHVGGLGVGDVLLVTAAIALAVRVVLRRRATPRQRTAAAMVQPPRPEPPPARLTDLDQGVQDIRRTDRGFDAARFAGYAGMTFRDVESACMTRDVAGLRDRLTPQMYAELLAVCDRLRAAGRSPRFERLELAAETTEAWQDGDQDYVTAYVVGSTLSHTVDDATGKVVDGSRTTPIPVAAFLTFTRPAGLNFWMLSVIQRESFLRVR
jgi:predicted lipid-binding transport protein (Tim44 family)